MKKLFLTTLFLFTLSILSAARPVVALVLSGGGARGISQIAVIKELERRGIYPDIVTGTSMGALIGGLYSAGWSGEELEEFVKSADINGALLSLEGDERLPGRAYSPYDETLLSLNFTRKGIGTTNSVIDDGKTEVLIRSALCRVMNVSSFDELPITFRAVGTDLVTGESVVFSSDLYRSLRGSMSLPMIFSPVRLDDGRYIADGGIADNLPSSVARDLGADIVIAVDVNDSVRENGRDPSYLETFSGVATQFIILVSQGNVRNEHTLSDYLFIPDTGDVSVIDFTDVERILGVGEECVRENAPLFDEIEKALDGYLPMEKPVSYTDIDYFTVHDITLPEGLSGYGKLFSAFEGRLYDEEFVSEFSRLLSAVRRREGLRGLSYEVKGDSIIVSARKYEERIMNAGLGASFSLSFLATSETPGYIYLDPGVSFDFSYGPGRSRVSGAARIGDVNRLSLGWTFPITGSLDLTLSAEGAFGFMQAVSAMDYPHRTPTQDGSLMAGASLTSFFSGERRLDFLISAEIVSLDLFSDAGYQVRSVSASLFYRTENPLYSGELMLSAGYSGRLSYVMKGDFTLTPGPLRLNVKAASIRGDERLSSSYVRDAFSFRSRDIIDTSLLWHFDTSCPLFVEAGGFFALSEHADLSGDLSISPVPFTALRKISWGGIISVGLDSGPDLRLTASLSDTLDFSIGLTLK